VVVKVGGPVVAVVVLAWGATTIGAFSGFFKAVDVEVRGLHRVAQEGMLSRSGLLPAPNLLALDLNEVASRILGESWIKQVKLERRLPNRLIVDVVERSPVAVITAPKLGGPGEVLVDAHAVVLSAAEEEDRRRLPIIVGAKGPAPAPGSVFDDPAVASGLAVLHATEGLPLVGRKSLALVDCTYPERIVMRGRRSHTVVVLRGGGLELKFARLKTLAAELKRRHGSIEYIDLSFERRVIIKGFDKES
jgi:cell division protein FtsQ